MTDIKVLKRNGEYERYDADKINQVVQWACEGLDVSPSEILMKMQVQLFDGIKTEDLQKLVIKSAADLIEVWQSDYQYVAARLLMYDIRKKAFWNYDPPTLKDHVHDIVNLGWYDPEIVQKYSDEEMDILDKHIVHDRDYLLAYAGAEQWATKYLVQNRVTGEVYESPQIALMLIAMCLHQEEHEDRIQKVIDFYDEVSLQKLSLPTPIMAGVRTPTRQFSSCTLIESGDTEDRIFNAVTAVGKYAAKRAGIGLNLGAIRAQGAPIRGGEAKHAGLVGITKMFQETLGWVSQGGTRKGSMTVFFPVWHKDVRQLLVLKNNRGTEDNRARHIDYAFQFNKLMYERLIKNENITLFSPDVANGKLYEYFFSDQDKFEELYVELEKTEKFKEVIPAIELFSIFAQERAQTGRIYLQNVDHCNTNSPFNAEVAPIKQSNLCMEVVLPTKPIDNLYYDENAEIALCTLAAFNLGKLVDMTPNQRYESLLKTARVAVRSLDNLLDYQGYPVKAAEKNKLRRTLGIGVIDYAHYLASKGLKYSDGSANNETHELFEQIQYCLLQASYELAKEKGACELFHETSYAKGVLPIDRYKKSVDNIHTAELKMEWEPLRWLIKKYGLRNSTLSALMPSETSSQISNATNGIEPPRDLLSIKSSGDVTVRQIVPNVINLFADYEKKWEMDSPRGYLELCAIMQKFVDQTISANTFYKPQMFEGGKFPIQTALEDIVYAYSLGIKTLYYHETKDGNDQDEGCESGACKI